MKVIGLTGGIATGKSAVANILIKEFDIPVIDADQIARQVVAPGEEGLDAIVQSFSGTVLNAQGGLDRRKMRALISQDDTVKDQLEQILHPLIRKGIQETIAKLAKEGASLVFVEAALLVETGSYKNYDLLWVVSCSPDLQLKRLMFRDSSTLSQAQRLIDIQVPQEEKRSVADLILHNDGKIDALRKQISKGLSGLV